MKRKLIINGVNFELLEKQRQSINGYLLYLAISERGDASPPIGDTLEALHGVMAMLDEWSDGIYFSELGDEDNGKEIEV